MMGGGFGGAVIALVQESRAQAIADTVARGYLATTGLKATIYVASIGAGSSATRLQR